MEMENLIDELDGFLVVILELHEAQDKFLGRFVGEFLLGGSDELPLSPVVDEDFEFIVAFILGILRSVGS